MAAGSLATNDTNTTATPTTTVTTKPVPPRPDLHLPLDAATIGGLIAGGALVIFAISVILVCVCCIGIYQVCDSCDHV